MFIRARFCLVQQRGRYGPVPDRIGQLPEPFDGDVAEGGFGEVHGIRSGAPRVSLSHLHL